MPKKLDLTGRRFGRLVVIEPAGLVKYGHLQQAWRCRCDCGGEIVLPQRRLPYAEYIRNHRSAAVTSCQKCRELDCVVCGKKTGSLQKNTCSDACAKIKRARVDKEQYKRRLIEDPDANRHRWDVVKHKAATNKSLADRLKSQERARTSRRQERIANDPAYRERVNAAARARYAKNKKRVQAQRVERWAALTPEQKAEKKRRYKEIQAEYYQRHADSEEFVNRRKATHREWLKKKSHEDLAAIQTALEEKLGADDG